VVRDVFDRGAIRMKYKVGIIDFYLHVLNLVDNAIQVKLDER